MSVYHIRKITKVFDEDNDVTSETLESGYYGTFGDEDVIAYYISDGYIQDDDMHVSFIGAVDSEEDFLAEYAADSDMTRADLS